MKLSMQQAKEIAKKKYKESSSKYWKYVYKLLDEDFHADMPTNSPSSYSNNPYQAPPAKAPDLQTQIKTSLVNQGTANPDKIANEALDLATQKAPTNLSKSDPTYWPTVMQNAEQMAGVQSDIQQAGKPMTGANQPQQPNSVTSNNSMFSATESYVSFKDSSTALPISKDKITEVVKDKAIKDIVKDLRAGGRTDNEIIFTLINRYRLNQLDAYDVVYTGKKEPKEAVSGDPMDIRKNSPEKIKINEFNNYDIESDPNFYKVNTEMSPEDAWKKWHCDGDDFPGCNEPEVKKKSMKK